MTIPTEAERVFSHIDGEPGPPVYICILGDCPEGAEVSLERVKEVMLIIASQNREAWPDESGWIQLLPTWFEATFKKHSLDEIVADESLWHFQSWLDAMRLRGWEWWSSKLTSGATWKIQLVAYEWPYSIGPIEYLAKVSGAFSVSWEEK